MTEGMESVHSIIPSFNPSVSGSFPPQLPSDPTGTKRANKSSVNQPCCRGAAHRLPVQITAVGELLHTVGRFPQTEGRLLYHRPLAHAQRQPAVGMLGQTVG